MLIPQLPWALGLRQRGRRIHMSPSTSQELLNLVRVTLNRALEQADGHLDQAGINQALESLANEPAFGGARATEETPLLSPYVILTDPFDVLLTRRFMHLMASPHGRSLSEGALSLRVLPGFFQVVRMMIGTDRYKAYQAECHKLAQKIKENNPPMGPAEFSKALSMDPEAKHIALVVYARMGLWFSQYKKRKDWFISIINSNLGAVPPGLTDPDEKRWQFTKGHFTELFTILFLEDVILTMLNDEAREKLHEEFGAESISQLNDMLQSIGTDMDQYFCGPEE